MTKSLLILVDVTDDIIDKFGEHIDILNNMYDVHWKLIKLPGKFPWNGEASDDFKKGWNSFRETILTSVDEFKLDLAFKEIEKIFNYAEK